MKPKRYKYWGPRKGSDPTSHYQKHEEDLVFEYRYLLGISCPHCGVRLWDDDEGYHTSLIETRNVWKCGACRKQFSDKHGTIFVDSALPFWKWFVAIWFVTNAQGMPNSRELSRLIKVRQETAWGMIQKIKNALLTDNIFYKWAVCGQFFVRCENVQLWKFLHIGEDTE